LNSFTSLRESTKFGKLKHLDYYTARTIFLLVLTKILFSAVV